MTTVLLVWSLLTGQAAVPTPHARSLIVLAGATDVKFFTDYDGAVKYHLKAAYPALLVIDAIKNQLKEQGWVPRKFSLLNPGIPTSHLDGWGEYFGRNGDLIHQWGSDWTAPDGGNVAYRFMYAFPEGRGGVFMPNDMLEVIAIHMSAETVKARLKSLGLPQ